MKSDKMPYIIYADIESLIKKIDGCAANPENPSTTKKAEQVPCGYSLSTIYAFYHIMEKTVWKSFANLYKNTRKIWLILKRKKMLPLTKEEQIDSRCKSMLCLWKKKLNKSSLKVKTIRKLGTIATIQVNIPPQHILFVI